MSWTSVSDVLTHHIGDTKEGKEAGSGGNPDKGTGSGGRPQREPDPA